MKEVLTWIDDAWCFNGLNNCFGRFLNHELFVDQLDIIEHQRRLH
jgi:hypothetical protein